MSVQTDEDDKSEVVDKQQQSSPSPPFALPMLQFLSNSLKRTVRKQRHKRRPSNATQSQNDQTQQDAKNTNPIDNVDSKWLETTCLDALNELVSLFVRYFDTTRFMLKKVCELIKHGANQVLLFFFKKKVYIISQLKKKANEKTAKASVNCWRMLIDGIANTMNEEEWTIALQCAVWCASQTLPYLLSQRYYEQVRSSKGNTTPSQQSAPVSLDSTIARVQSATHQLIIECLFQ
ncbi:hypothetical protein RFI_09321, partial [Reticulomyxa filosa]